MLMLRTLFKACLTLCLFSSCSSTLMQHEASTAAYKQGHLSQAETILTRTIAKEMPSGNFQQSKEAVCLLLNRATIHFASGNIDEAIADYNLAIEALDYYAQDSTLDSAGQVLLEDGSAAYNGSDLEHLLARIYFALALIEKGDINNAYALLRQAEEIQQTKTQRHAKVSYLSAIACDGNALGKFLFATLLDQQGDVSNAAILFRQAEALAGCMPTEINLPPLDPKKKATVILICHNGIVPFKISGTSPASLASTLALEAILCTQRIDPAWSSITGIPTPLLCQQPQSEPLPTYATINKTRIPLKPWFNIAQATSAELEQNMPVIVARGVARYLIRRTAVAQAQKHDPHLGALVDLGMLIANANTQADTRSWSTLPSSIDLARCILPAGEHCLTITVARQGLPNFEQHIPLQLKAGDLCFINIFNINPRTTKILVPSQFRIKGDPL
ncbi:MAG: hypothetical protein H0X29_06975 [Parachlamydiaceae bacterium]|nr:hypothetical protein [Parachlamydiaceae bacterium]